MTWLDVGGQRSRSQQAKINGVKGFHVDAGARFIDGITYRMTQK